ncbi:helix-turn-helix domain-containing protein [Paenibacillus cellulosilyticus]|nr:helix-turn-helix transcriptional regulator [Paenibacillus cellulosilyticus]
MGNNHLSFAEKIGQRLKQVRLNKGLSAVEVCKQLNIGTSSMSNYERGERMPSLEILIKISELYEMSIDELVGVRKYDTDEDAWLMDVKFASAVKKKTLMNIWIILNKMEGENIEIGRPD